MSLGSEEFIGCSIDGLRDSLYAFNSQQKHEFGFFLADAIFSKESFGKPLVGEGAETSRIHSGLPWPQEARFPHKAEDLKRIPIPLCWRLLIDGGDRIVTWNGQDVNRLLAFHFADRISSQMQSGQKEFCLAVPDGLSDLAQERLYKSLKQRCQIPGDGLMLVRRSVASALSWLDKTQLEINDLLPNDHLLVVYLGPDAFEWSILGLRKVKTTDGKQFIVPVRDYRRQSKSSPYSGCDVLDGFVLNTLNIKDFQARWRLLTGVPDIWCLLNRANIERKHSEVLFADGAWKLWEYDPFWKNTIWQSKAGRTDFMKEIGLPSCNEGQGLSWRDYLKDFLSEDSLQNIRLRGVVFSGSILSGERTFVDEHLLSILKKHNPSARIETIPKKDNVWFPDRSVDSVSQGGAIFSYRTHNNLPTYFDVIPQISIYVSTRRGLNWRPLLKDDSTEIVGGRIHEEVPPEKLNLARGGDKVEGYLKRGEKIKRAVFSFSSPPKEDVELDVHLRLSATKGLAEIELVPQEKYFLFEGQRIRLDFMSMDEIEEEDLPKKKARYPYVQKFIIDSQDRFLMSQFFVNSWEEYKGLDEFFNASSGTILKNFRSSLSKQRTIQENGGKWVSYFLIDQDGKPSSENGRRLVQRILKKIDADLRSVFLEYKNERHLVRRKYLSHSIRYLMTISSWFYGGATKATLEYLQQRLNAVFVDGMRNEHGISIQNLVLISGRIITSDKDFQLLLQACEKEVQRRRVDSRPQVEKSGIFPYYWARAFSQILSTRELCIDVMRKEQVSFILTLAHNNIRKGIRDQKKQLFFWNITLILYLLRFRIKDPDFLSVSDTVRHKSLLEDLELAKGFCKRARLADKYIRQVLNLEAHLLEVGSGDLPVDYLFSDDEEDSDE